MSEKQRDCDKCNEVIPKGSFPFHAAYEQYWCEKCAEDLRDELLEWDRQREAFYDYKERKQAKQ